MTETEQMNDGPRLISVSPDRTAYPLSGTETTIGRAGSNTISLPGDESVSRFHAHIRGKLGLFWLEDRESTNGTFLTPPDASELHLAPGKCTLLFDGAVVRVGLAARFEVHGTAGSPDRVAGLQDLVREGYRLLGMLPPGDRDAFLLSIRDYQARLFAAASEAEFDRLVAEGIRPLSKTVFGSLDHEDLGVFGQDLPPLAGDLPDPEAPRPPTVHGSIVPGMIEPDEPDEDDRP
jgi:hypothetical protein